jgi:hypothetical protein
LRAAAFGAGAAAPPVVTIRRTAAVTALLHYAAMVAPPPGAISGHQAKYASRPVSARARHRMRLEHETLHAAGGDRTVSSRVTNSNDVVKNTHKDAKTRSLLPGSRRARFTKGLREGFITMPGLRKNSQKTSVCLFFRIDKQQKNPFDDAEVRFGFSSFRLHSPTRFPHPPVTQGC